MICGEEGAAETEAGYGYARADPAVVFARRDQAQTQVYRVTCTFRISIQLDYVCGEAGYSPVCMLTKLPQINTLALSNSPVMI